MVPNAGHVILILSGLFFVIASYAVLFSAFSPLTGNFVRQMTFQNNILINEIQVLDALANDAHYKYFAILIVPTGCYFVIANWVGWQYYRNS
jgi:hypothetical protein